METNNYHMVTFEDEKIVSNNLVKKIIDSDWVKRDTILVNCFPEYSSRITHLLSHKLSYLNNNEPFETMDIKMPYPTMVQVWHEEVYQMYPKYLLQRIWNIKSNQRYLFVGADAFDAFLKLKALLRGKIDKENYRFVTLFKPKESEFIPDLFAHEYDGILLFQWENIDNPNKINNAKR